MSKIKSVQTKSRQNMKKRVACISTCVTAALCCVTPGFCDINGNTSAQKVIKIVFNVIMLAGIVLIAAGAVMLIKTIVSIASGEQAQPGAIGKALGLLIGGIVAAALHPIVTAIIGQDPFTMTFY